MSDSKKYPKLSNLVWNDQFDRIAELIHRMHELGFDFKRPDETFKFLTEQETVGLGEYETMCEIARAASYGRLRVALVDDCLDDKKVFGSEVAGYVDDALDMAANNFAVRTYFDIVSKTIVVYGYDKRIVHE